MRVLRRLELALPGELIAAAVIPAGSLAVACHRGGDLLLSLFEVGGRSDQCRRSERLLRLGVAPRWPAKASLLSVTDGSDQVVVVAGVDVFRVDPASMTPVWRFCLDGDGGGVCAVTDRGFIVADPPGRATHLDWNGDELGSVRLAGDVVAADVVGDSVILALATGEVHRWCFGGETTVILSEGPRAAPRALVCGRPDGHGHVLWFGDGDGPSASVLNLFNGSVTQIPCRCYGMVHTSDGCAAVGTDQGVWIIDNQSARTVGDFASITALCSSPTGHVVGCTGDGLLLIPSRGTAQMMPFERPSIVIPDAPGVWVLGSSGQLEWLT